MQSSLSSIKHSEVNKLVITRKDKGYVRSMTAESDIRREKRDAAESTWENGEHEQLQEVGSSSTCI